MVIPHDPAGKSFSLKISDRLVYAVAGVCAFVCLLTASSFIYSAHLSRKLVYYSNAVEKNKQQKLIIESFGQKTDQMHQAIDEIAQEDESLRKMLGLKNWKSKIKLSSNIKTQEAGQINQSLKLVDQKLAERKKSYEELKEWVNTVRSRFASTPSRWPVYGQIVSRYGYRIYPWRGFHSGIDISGRYGTPIRVTADGVVKSVAWRSGYGKTVIVDHGHGVATLYAHLSKYDVKPGQKVYKGQVICYIGNTGYSTGPHLHYEVRRNDNPVSPTAYLDLNILSASKIWGN